MINSTTPAMIREAAAREQMKKALQDLETAAEQLRAATKELRIDERAAEGLWNVISDLRLDWYNDSTSKYPRRDWTATVRINATREYALG